MENIKRIMIISSDKNLREVLHFCFDGWGYEVFLQESFVRDVALIKKVSPHVIIVDVHSASKTHLEICRLLKDDFLTAFIPVITLINKRQLRAQLLSLKQGVDDYLIKPPDPLDLRIRIEMAIRRSQYSYYATPLTGLPGGRIIEEVLGERLKKEAQFSFGYADIDNFKCFNDAYGYLKGDRIIMQTAYMLYTTIKRFGNSDDFIGHIGGDDFVFLTTPDKYKDICQHFVAAFDRVAPFHYPEEDRHKGYIIAKDRSHKIKQVPFMSVSVAVVNRRSPLEFKNIIEINERIAEIKRYLKGLEGSKFMADRRSSESREHHAPHTYKKYVCAGNPYKPLGQILLEKNIVTHEQLDEALKIHWKRGILLGEILKEMGFVKEGDLEQALHAQSQRVMREPVF